MAQLVERSLPTPEIRGSNPVIGKLLYRTFNCLSTVNCIEKTKIKKKEVGNGPFKKTSFQHGLREQLKSLYWTSPGDLENVQTHEVEYYRQENKQFFLLLLAGPSQTIIKPSQNLQLSKDI